jgi:hypothetical protein
MRRRIRRELDADGVRAVYAQELRQRWAGSPAWGHFGRIVAQLEAGEPVVAPWWAVGRFRLSPPHRGGTTHVRLEPDGSVTPIVPIRVGVEILGWEPP